MAELRDRGRLLAHAAPDGGGGGLSDIPLLDDGQQGDTNKSRPSNYNDTSSNNNNNSNSNNNKSDQNANNNRTTDAQTMMHILKANIGTGILAMPNAFKNVGLWTGFVLVPIIGAICIHCMNILIASHNRLCDRFNYESLDYDQVAALALACGPKWARRSAKYANLVVSVFLIFTQVGFCCVYIMFVVENLQLAVLNLLQVEYSTTTYLLLVFPIIGLTSCTSNLKHLARISTLANILQLAGLALIFFDLCQFHTYGEPQQQAPTNMTATEVPTTVVNSDNNDSLSPAPSSQQAVHHGVPIRVSQLFSEDILAGLPLFFATAVYAFEGIGVVLPVIKEMQHPGRIQGLNGVLNTSMSMVALSYMAIGFFGYAKYGQLVQGSITLNLPETTLNELVRLIFAIAIGLSYSLQFYVPWTIMWPHIDESLFYSYRPREARDKLDILNKLSSDNEWALCSSDAKRRNDDDEDDDDSKSSPDNEDCNSTASTMATSYSMSTCLLPQGQQLSSGRGVRRHQQSGSMSLSVTLNQYGTISVSGLTGQQRSQKVQLQRQPRNRLADVMEHERLNCVATGGRASSEDDDEPMPEVQWRPPPRSMRGKRKLVRYTVILLTVSFTFVAAALIPRLDLFISLIGALASSCLAIIFPAIIQLCTFWRSHEDEDEHDDEHDEQGRPAGGRHSLTWCLFLAKNSFLIVFGILGLLTGTWVSLSKLSAVYLSV